MQRGEGFFGQTKRIGIYISVEDYSAIKGVQGEQLNDVQGAENEAKYMAAQFGKYGFDADSSHLVHNPNFLHLKKVMANVSSTCAENLENDEQTLVFVYFRGLAHHDHMTYALLNDVKKVYPLEKQLRALSTEDNVFVVAFFDCARQQASCKEYFKIIANDDADQEIIMTFACHVEKEIMPLQNSTSRYYMQEIVKQTSIFGESKFPHNLRYLGENFETLIVCDVAVVIKNEKLKTAKCITSTSQISNDSAQPTQQEEVKQTNSDQQTQIEFSQTEFKFQQDSTQEEVKQQPYQQPLEINFQEVPSLAMNKTMTTWAKDTMQESSKYEGDKKPDGTFHGKGRFEVKDKYIYTGSFEDGKFKGQGELTVQHEGTYTGTFENDKLQGVGKFTALNGDSYKGQFVDGQFNGLGHFTFGKVEQGCQAPATYSGNFKDGRFDGLGRKEFGDGGYYEGSFQQDMYKGQGRLVLKSGWVYAGNFFRNKLNGVGSLTSLPQKRSYTGMFVAGKFCGIGIYTFADGVRWHGRFRLGIPEGNGEYIPKSSKAFEENNQKGDYFVLCKGRALIGGNIPKPILCKNESCKAEIDKSYKFCAKCGTPTATSKPIICSNCKVELSSDQKFCAQCGTSVTK